MMFSGSHVGATQVPAAARAPEWLNDISPPLTTGRHGATWTYRGGAIELGFLLLWIIESLGPQDLQHRLSSMPAADAKRPAPPVVPIVRYFRSGSNIWHAAPDWPLPGTASYDLFLPGYQLGDTVTEN